MKTLDELYEEIQNDDELKEEFTASFKEGVIDDFLKDHECDATAEDVVDFLNSLNDGAISDDDLDKVAGGFCSSRVCRDDDSIGMRCV